MIGIFETQVIELFFVGIPESVGVLAFGLALTTAAVLTRWLLGRAETAKSEKKFDGKLTR